MAGGESCPSGRCQSGAVLLGIVSPDGAVAYLQPRMPIDETFVEEANRVGIRRSDSASPSRAPRMAAATGKKAAAP